MKKCPYCAEEIQDEAIKCRHCGEMLEKKPSNKWYLKTSALIIGFLCVGPLVLPLVWINPRFNWKVKVVISAIMVVVSYYLGVMFVNSLKTITQYYSGFF